jgi:sugar-specific transcriptional regulator TrmB
MKRIDQYKSQLKAAKSDLRHRQRQFNSAQRSLWRTEILIETLTRKIHALMAKT